MQDEASRLFKCGYNCAQSVFAAHAPKLGIDKETALRISAPLGGGVGRMRQTCGAFLACAMLWGLTHPVPIHWRLKNRSIKILNAWLKYSFPKTVPLFAANS